MAADELYALVPGWRALRPAERRRLAQALEVVDVAAGEVAAPAGVAGVWRTLVVLGTVATTCPPRQFVAGDVLAHGRSTALVAVTDCRLLTVDARHELAAALGPVSYGADVRPALGQSVRA